VAPATPSSNNHSQAPSWCRVKTLWPKKSVVSGNKIPMFSTAYHLKQDILNCTDDGVMTLETDQWMTEREFLFEKIKGNV